MEGLEGERPLKVHRVEHAAGSPPSGPAAAAARAAPSGPASMDESDLWPERFLSMMHQVGCLQFFMKAVESGIHLSTEYSGIGTAEEACRCLVRAVVKLQNQDLSLGLDVDSESQAAKGLLFVQRSGDKDGSCRAVLLMQQEVLGVLHCVHGDIGERCNLDLWEHAASQVKIMQESQTCRKHIQPQAFAKDIFKEFMKQDLRSVKGLCYAHECHCPLAPCEAPPHRALFDSPPPLSTASDSDVESDSKPAAPAAAPPEAGYPLRRFRLHVAGFSCIDWSGMNRQRKGWCGDTLLPFCQWLAERMQFDEDCVIGENTIGFDVDTLAEIVEAHGFTCDTLQVSPVLLGEAVERQRLYIIMLRKSRFRWRKTEVNDLQASFSAIFGNDVLMAPAEKFRAPSTMVEEFVSGLANAAKLPPATRSGRKWSCFQAMSASMRDRLKAHEAKRQDMMKQQRRHSTPLAASPQEEDDMWISNLGQNPDYMAPCRGAVPALLKASRLWLYGKKRLALAEEHLEVQGWNLMGASSSAYKSPMRLAELTDLGQQKLLAFAGNGMHVHVVAAVIAFTLAFVERVEDA